MLSSRPAPLEVTVGGKQATPTTATMQSLPGDVWQTLAKHLPPAALFCMLQTSRRLHTSVRPHLHANNHAHIATGCTAETHRHSILQALHDPPLAAFLLMYTPPLAPPHHPLPAALRLAHLPPPVARALVTHFLRSSRPSALHAVLAEARPGQPLIAVASHPAVGLSGVVRLVDGMTRKRQSVAACMLLEAFPDVVDVTAARLPCASGCSGCRGLLHTVAEVGDVEVARVALAVLRDTHLLNARDCAGDTPLSLAILRRRSRVAQQLVRAGAEVRELVGCAARGGAALDAGDVWFKPVVDVD